MSIKLIAIVFIVGALLEIQEVDGQRIGGDAMSTMRIVYRLCVQPGDHNDWLAYQFFGCYDQAPGKHVFVTCQRRIYGAPLDSKRHIDVACQSSSRLQSYARCLQNEFHWAGINMQNAVTRVNICQGRVLGF